MPARALRTMTGLFWGVMGWVHASLHFISKHVRRFYRWWTMSWNNNKIQRVSAKDQWGPESKIP